MTIKCLTNSRALYNYCIEEHNGRILGVFNSGIYMENEDGSVCVLHDIVFGYLPFGFACTEVNRSYRELGFVPGDTITICNGRLFKPGGITDFLLSYVSRVELEPAMTAPKAIKWMDKNGIQTLLDKGVRAPAMCVFQDRFPFARERAFSSVGVKGASMLRKGLLTSDIACLEKALMSLLGLGWGLTPSFDDFITGAVSLINYYLEETGDDKPVWKEFRNKIIELAPQRTNKYSAAHLVSVAGNGKISLIDDLIRSAGTGAWDNYLERALKVGSSSGADMVSGILFTANTLNSASKLA